MTVCLSVCQFVSYQDYVSITTCLIFMKTCEKMGLDPTWIPLDFETDLDKCPAYKKYQRFGFSHLLIITCLGRDMHSASAVACRLILKI